MATLNIPVAKAGGKVITVDTEELFPDNDIGNAMMLLCIEEGLKVIAGKKMSKITGQSKMEEGSEELRASHAAAYDIALKNIDEVRQGKATKGRAKASGAAKISREVMTEARRLAKEVIKNEIRAAGMKISHVEARDITAAANNLLETDPSYIEQAKTNIEARNTIAPVNTDDENVKAAAAAKLASLGFAGESPKLLKAAEERKTASKAILSKTQAGKAAPRKGQAATAH